MGRTGRSQEAVVSASELRQEGIDEHSPADRRDELLEVVGSSELLPHPSLPRSSEAIEANAESNDDSPSRSHNELELQRRRNMSDAHKGFESLKISEKDHWAVKKMQPGYGLVAVGGQSPMSRKAAFPGEFERVMRSPGETGSVQPSRLGTLGDRIKARARAHYEKVMAIQAACKAKAVAHAEGSGQGGAASSAAAPPARPSTDLKGKAPAARMANATAGWAPRHAAGRVHAVQAATQAERPKASSAVADPPKRANNPRRNRYGGAPMCRAVARPEFERFNLKRRKNLAPVDGRVSRAQEEKSDEPIKKKLQFDTC